MMFQGPGSIYVTEPGADTISLTTMFLIPFWKQEIMARLIPGVVTVTGFLTVEKWTSWLLRILSLFLQMLLNRQVSMTIECVVTRDGTSIWTMVLQTILFTITFA